MYFMQWISVLLLCIVFLFPHFAKGSPSYGANFSYGLVGKEPADLQGFQLMANYDPDRFKWRQFNIYFDGGISHFWVTNSVDYSKLNIFSVASVVRYTFKRHGPLLPYFEISIGAAYLQNTRIENRNLGIHFAFQDRMGIGAFLGFSENLTIGIHALHYSNLHFSSRNSGITMPLVLDIGYRL